MTAPLGKTEVRIAASFLTEDNQDKTFFTTSDNCDLQTI